MADLRFDWNRKKYGDRYSENWEAIIVLSDTAIRLRASQSVFLYLEADNRYPGVYWSVSAWNGDPSDEEWTDCWFTTDCFGETNTCDTLEEAQKCAEDFVIHFRESLEKEADLHREWLVQQLAAIDRLKKILEERESNVQ